ncbi:hypothetical protein BUY22_08085 [Staphylococcus cohnii]|uniref:hypothetical protein n=1 Tax=Staphylococcus sp. LKG8-2 TaxID=3399689 RepID=UPI000ED139CA|nr:hypothetical protein BUY22_08085 [Staphylococcus cohnii]
MLLNPFLKTDLIFQRYKTYEYKYYFEFMRGYAKTVVDTPTAKAMGFFSTKSYASISSLYLPKVRGMPMPHPSSEHIVN